jgi:tetratricopeptide (TPR) repeat protein
VIGSCNRKCTYPLGGAFVHTPLLFCLLLLIAAVAHGADSAQALRKAVASVQQGRLEEADRQARLALSDPQSRAVACSVLGTVRFQQKRLPESIHYFEEAIRLQPHLLGAHLSLAEVYTIQGKQDLALRLYRRILELDPSNATARLALARSEAEKGDYRRSLDLVRPVLPTLKQSPDGLLLLAANFVKTGDHAAAAQLAKDWTNLADAPPAWSIKFALLLAEGGVVAEAIDILEGTRQNSDPSYELEFDLAGLYLLKKEPARALEHYDQALRLKPTALPALRQAGAIAERQGELERSLSYWLRAKKIDANDPEILLAFGRVCLKMDLLEDAEPALARAVTLRQDPTYLYTLAAAKVGKRQFQAAHALLEEILRSKQGDPQLQYALGSVLYLEGNLNDSATHLRESIRLQPEQLAPYYYLALVVRDQGNEAAAIRTLEDVLRRYPDHGPSCEALGGLLMNAHRYPEAETSLEKAVRLNPKSVKANYQLGLLLSRIGKKDEADKQLEVAKSLRKEDEASSRLQLRLLDPDQ